MGDRLVLCYHAVSDRWPASLAVSPQRLREQVALLLRRGYSSVTFAELTASRGSGKLLSITFDDGYRSVLERGLPVLAELGAVATIFVPTQHVGSPAPMRWPGIDRWTPGPHQDELHCLSWSQLRWLRDRGWGVGSHSHSHPRLTQLDQRSLTEELARSREICERELGECLTLAYPYGDSDERVEDAARAAGYEAAAVLRLGPESTFSWPRVGVFAIDDRRRFRVKVSPAVRRLRATSVIRRLERARP